MTAWASSQNGGLQSQELQENKAVVYYVCMYIPAFKMHSFYWLLRQL